MYYIYNRDECPPELIAKYPNHATYNPYGEDEVYLFGESLGDVTGVTVQPADIHSFIGGDADEDFKGEEAYDIADAAEYEGDTPEERQALRVAARTQARIDARVAARIAMRVATRTAIRQADRREIRFNASQGKKIYDEWLAAQPIQP